VEEAPTRQMLSNPQKAYTKSLWAVRSLQKDESRGDDMLLRVDHVDAGYGRGLMVLKDVSIAVPRGRTVAVVGESGSGKSTLARVITGLLPPLKGEVFYDGKALPPALKNRSKDLLRRMQMIYQMPDTALNPRRRVHDILGRPLTHQLGMHGAERQRRIRELLEMIEMDERFLDRLPSELSGGQKQRICIARALAADPEVLIADEPVSALDVSIQAQILNLLADLRVRLRLSMIFISHDLHVVRYIAPRIAVMFGGRIVEILPAGVPLEGARHPYTEALLAARSRLEPGWLARTGQLDGELAAALPAVGCPFRARCPHAMAVCETADPALRDIGSGHAVACHYVA
jgi:peptide/nickel transport system ATP-binding protein